ncbi:LysE family transporter [Thermanaeromonas sp. C210]|uniref:LysE family transporter n=1 Tax=Thermanaeromonas sp. C210 TaxID=2731925 RepID=UPI00155B470E|nr:LysE family transporter [Thermanaeromonas sp. C210]GFN24027.1 lysine transporter LysE [Thermanaeromonas sp. C210]
MQLITIFLTAFTVGLSGAMMPGPLLTVTIGEAARRGFLAGPLLVLGHGILEGVLVVALAMGLGSFFAMDTVARVIAMIGGVFLIYMGWGIFRDAWYHRVTLNVDPAQADNPEETSSSPRKYMNLVLAGVLVSLSNPYWTLWWATVGLGYIVLSLKQGVPGLVSFFSGHILSDLAWYSLVAVAVAKGRHWVTPVIYRGILLVCGLFLIFLGGSFTFWGVWG